MADNLQMVILPGLDGTGRVLTRFVEALQLHFDVSVITYPANEPLSYDQLLDYVKARLPKEDFILIGESFSGPLAMRAASENLPFLRGVVLGASFVRLDLPFKSALLRLIDWIPPSIAPAALLDGFLMNGRATPAERKLLKGVLHAVDPKVLSGRTKDALLVDLVATGTSVALPTLYLRAAKDRLIPSHSANLVALLASNLTIREIQASHFLFHMEPDACVEAIMEFLGSSTLRRKS